MSGNVPCSACSSEGLVLAGDPRDPYGDPADRPDRADPHADPFAPVRARTHERHARRTTPWPMIIGVALLAVLALVLAILVMGGGTGDPAESSDPSASAAASDGATPGASATASAGASGTPSASASAAAQPSVPPVDVAIDSIVVTTVDALSVRAAPGTGAERLGTLENGAPSFVVDGPTDADGYRWYLISGLGLPPNTGCAGPFETDPFNCPVWFGWVATGSPDGVAWLEPQEPDCAQPPIAFEEIVLGVTDLVRLACFGADPVTFRAWWPAMEDDAGPGGACASQDEPSGWLLCQNTNQNLVVVDDSQQFEGIGLRVSIDPDSGVSMPPRGTWLELTVHLDDPAAQACGDDAVGAMAEERSPEEWVLFCRGQMVVEAVTAVDGP